VRRRANEEKKEEIQLCFALGQESLGLAPAGPLPATKGHLRPPPQPQA
jgi:hypothetical protein